MNYIIPIGKYNQKVKEALEICMALEIVYIGYHRIMGTVEI